MIAFQVSEHVTRIFPPPLVSTNCAKAATEPPFRIDTEKDAIYLTRLAIVVLACFVPRQLPRQGLLRDTINEDGRQQGGGTRVATTRGASSLHLNNVAVEFCGRSRPLAIAGGAGRIEGGPLARTFEHWSFRALVNWGRGSLIVREGRKLSRTALTTKQNYLLLAEDDAYLCSTVFLINGPLAGG